MKKRISALLLTLIMAVSYVSPAVNAVELADDIIIDNITETEIQETDEEETNVISETEPGISDVEQQEIPADEAAAEDIPAADETVTEDIPSADETVTEDTPAADETVTENVPAADETVTENVPAVNETVTEGAQNSTVASESDIVDQDSCGDTVDWTLYKDGKLVISGMGNMYLVGSAGLYSYSNRSSEIKEVVIEDGVTSVGNYAFSAFPNLEKVTIADSVTYIGEEAFSECTSLATIVMPASLSSIGNLAFVNCEKLENISLGNSLTSIGNNAFLGCVSLKSISIPEGVTAIPDYAFDGCSALETVSLPQGIKVIGVHAFFKCTSLKEIVLPSGLEDILDEAFCGCTGITSVTIPDSLVSLGEGIFKECTALEAVTLPASLKSIGSECFNGCTSLKSITLPETVAVISRAAFANCSALKTANMPAALEFIGAEAFLNCVALSSDINIPQGVTEIKDSTFENCKFITAVTMTDNVTSIGTSAFSDCVALKDITMSENLTSVGAYAFYGCSRLSAVNLPDSITSIGDYTFYECNELAELVMPANLTSIGSHCFDGCIKIKSFILPESVTTVGNGAFANCSALESINLPAGLTSLSDKVFYCCAALEEITIPDSIKTIGNETFENCVSLSKIVLPANLEKIGNSSFSGCKKISDFTLPETVTEIGEYAFSECYSISKFVIPESVTEIKTETFFDCYSLESIELPETITAIGNKAFIGCSSLKEIEIPENVTAIGNNAFTNCEKLEYVIFAEQSKLNSIGSYAFVSCASLKEIKIPDGVAEIKNGTFDGCAALETAILPGNLTSIGEYAFSDCIALRDLSIPKTVIYIASSAFAGTEDTLTVAVVKNSFAEQYFKDNGFSNIKEFGIVVDDVTVEFNSTANLPEVTKYPESSTSEIEIIWVVEDTDIATVEYDENGNAVGIKAVGVGETVLKATDKFSGYSTTAAINVVLPEDVKLKITLNSPVEKIGLQAGDTRELEITFELNGETYSIPNNKFNFKSVEDKKVSKNVLVDENGVVTSLYTGTKSATAKITATLKSDSNKTASIAVKAIAKQIQELPLDRPAARYTDETGTEQEILAEATEYGYILAIPKEVVKNGDIAVELSGQFAEEVKEEFAAAEAKLPEIKWTTSDSKAAKISAAKSEEVAEGEDYKAIVTIKKGSTGIYTVSATANDINKASIAVDIDVRDYTPRLEKNSVTLNTFNETGAEIKLYTAYDAALENYDPETAMLIAEEDEEINVRLADENGNFYATYDAENKTVTIRSNKIVQKGVTGYNSKNTYKFDLLINTSKGITKQAVTIKVANKMPSVTVKQSGTFNSFYKDSEVFTAVTAKGAVVKGVTLVEGSTPTFITEYVPEAAATEETAAQKSGIKVRWADKTDPTTKYVKNKDKKMVADTSAELMVELEGYRKAVKVKYTVGIKETKPGLVQSRSSSKYTYLNRENEAITVTNKATGELIDFNSAEWSVVSNSGEYVTVTAEGEELKLTVNEENKFTSKKPTHSVKISVQEDKWVKPVEITHKVTVNLAKPTVSPKETTVSLRTWYADNVEMQFKASETNSPVPVFSFNSSSSDVNVQTEAAKIEFVQDGWKVTAKVKDGENVAKGSYSYTVTPEITLADGSTEALKAVKVTVKVDSEVPALSLDKKAVTLSGTGTDKDVFTAKANDTECPAPVRYEITADTKDKKVKAEAEKVLFTYDGWEITAGLDINNLPKNASYKYKATAYVQSADGSETALKTTGFTVKVSTPSVKASLSKTSVSLNRDILEAYEIVPSVTEGYEIVDVTVTPNTKAGEKIKVEYDRENNIITAKITDSTISKNSDKAYNYPVTVTAEIDKDGVTVQKELKLTLGIKVVSGARKLSTKASGSIDLAVREKGITYTITGVKNYNYELGDIETIRLEGDYKGTDINELFEIETVETAENEPVKVMVKAKADAEVKSGTEYKYKIIVDVKDAGEAASSTLKVKTKQTGLKLKVSGDLTVYHKHESGSITIKVTGPAGAKIAENGIVVNTAKSSSSLIKAVEFKAAVDNGDGTWTIDYEVVRMSLLKNGKSYKVVFEATPEGNGTDKAPQTFNVALKVKR